MKIVSMRMVSSSMAVMDGEDEDEDDSKMTIDDGDVDGVDDIGGAEDGDEAGVDEAGRDEARRKEDRKSGCSIGRRTWTRKRTRKTMRKRRSS